VSSHCYQYIATGKLTTAWEFHSWRSHQISKREMWL